MKAHRFPKRIKGLLETKSVKIAITTKARMVLIAFLIHSLKPEIPRIIDLDDLLLHPFF